ncbi:unnamed protein product [Paramecium octaurelia]|uniref:Uncharacterized protein n=1 Tax=Paramecium octaurelia TaxID=43137 RepID=A0A8S1WHF6_PAROT|nr:unnamed protein product [Paramecium octaurelia]
MEFGQFYQVGRIGSFLLLLLSFFQEFFRIRQLQFSFSTTNFKNKRWFKF